MNSHQIITLLATTISLSSSVQAQDLWKDLHKKEKVIDLTKGSNYLRFSDYKVGFLTSTQTVSYFRPFSDTAYDYTPSNRLEQRASKGMNQLGDINLQWKLVSSPTWNTYASAQQRLGLSHPILSETEISAQLNLPASLQKNLRIERQWKKVSVNGKSALLLQFVISNIGSQAIEIGALGFPMIFDNILQGHELDYAHHHNSFYDPYMGMDAGYLQVSRLDGKGSTLLVLPEEKTPFENYRPIQEDPTPIGLDFEGFYEWNVLSKSYADGAWKKAQQWNTPHSIVLQPGSSQSYGLKFVLTSSVKSINSTLIAERKPVAVGIPGYVLPKDVNGSLFLHYPKKVSSIVATPSDAIQISKTKDQNGWYRYTLKGQKYGRVKIAVTYQDGTQQTIHYKVIESEAKTIANYGRFLNQYQWFDQPDTNFHRAPGFITYDHETKRQVTQDSRAWIAGLSDEGGAGSWLGAAMKQFVVPDKTEVAKLERFVDTTLWGQIQYKEGANKFGVRKSLFFYAPDSLAKGTYDSTINFNTWSAWPIKEAMDPGRAYNYPHVAAAYWSLYRLARNHAGLVTSHAWDWYLTQAYETAKNMVTQAPYYAQFGQMEGTVFYYILKDLKAEGLNTLAEDLEAEMKKRAIVWDQLAFPFASEMPWDSTGQEEVFIWSLFFGFMDKAEVTYNAILAYDPTIPHWAYNGNARRYWDFLYGGKLQRIERMIHHYGTELNAIPLLEYYHRHPSDLYTLRVGYGGVLGGIANIDQDGFAPAAFHSFPSTLKNDGISGDYGSGFFGYAVNSESYLTDDKTFGWLSFGGNLSIQNNLIHYQLTTANRNRFFIAPESLEVNFFAGKIDYFDYDIKSKRVVIYLQPKTEIDATAVLSFDGKYKVKGHYDTRSDGKLLIPLTTGKMTTIILEKV